MFQQDGTDGIPHTDRPILSVCSGSGPWSLCRRTERERSGVHQDHGRRRQRRIKAITTPRRSTPPGLSFSCAFRVHFVVKWSLTGKCLLYDHALKCFQMCQKVKKTRSILTFQNIPGNGGGENRTRVRKQIHRTFSERRRLFTFPHADVSRHTAAISSFMMHGTGKAYRTHVRHSSHAQSRLVALPVRTAAPNQAAAAT